MARPVDQSRWNQDRIYYGYHSVDPSPLVPLPQLDSDLIWGSPTDRVHPWACHHPDCLSCRAMSASAASSRVAVTGPSLADPDHSDAIATSATHQPSVEGSVHQEQKSQPQNKKKNTRQAPEYGTFPYLPATPLQCKWEGCRYSGYFNREHELIRHLRKIHIAPRTHHCPVEDCAKVCNRGDNLLQHMKNRHGLG